MMYFATTIDSFVVCAALATMAVLYLRYSITPGWFAAIAGSAVVYAAFKIADFYPTLILFFPLFGIFLARTSGFSVGSLGRLFLLNFGFAAFVQLVFQDTPHMVASRDVTVPLRMFLNSFLTLAPTTLSLPVSGFLRAVAFGNGLLPPRVVAVAVGSWVLFNDSGCGGVRALAAAEDLCSGPPSAPQ